MMCPVNDQVTSVDIRLRTGFWVERQKREIRLQQLSWKLAYWQILVRIIRDESPQDQRPGQVSTSELGLTILYPVISIWLFHFCIFSIIKRLSMNRMFSLIIHDLEMGLSESLSSWLHKMNIQYWQVSRAFDLMNKAEEGQIILDRLSTWCINYLATLIVADRFVMIPK